MARIGRLAGALLAETEGRYFLIGDLKEPCDFESCGFSPPGELRPLEQPYVELECWESPAPGVLGAEVMHVELEGEALAQALAERMLIRRNASVSERLWQLALEQSAEDERGVRAVRWLCEVPGPIWEAVRESVLRCI